LANQTGEIDQPVKFNKMYPANGRTVAVDHRISETNPILGPEAG
jgi:hypothetical protein